MHRNRWQMIPYRFNQHRGRKFMLNIPSISNHVDAAPTSLGAITVLILSVMRPSLGVALSRSKVKRTTPTSFVKGENR